MYEELVSRLRDAQGVFPGYVLQCYGGHKIELSSSDIKEAANAIEELSKPRWIPVEERLPEAERKSYWVCTDTGYQCECRWTNNRFGIRELDEWGWSIFDIPQYQKVVAWMPLPKPYEPPKEE